MNPRSWVDRLLSGYAALVYLFLFLPIAVVIVFSFNAGRHVAELTGFSFRWYEEAWSNQFVLRALRNSLTIAATTAVLATILGTLAAVALNSTPRWVRRVFEQLTYVAIIVPGIVIGISTLVFVVTFFDWANPWLAYLWPAGDPPQFGLGLHTVIAAHTMFTTAIVTVLVRTRMAGMDRSLIEASEDLYATPWRTFRDVTIPQLLPAIVSGFLLAFTFSFDDFIVAFFTAGQDQTLPIFLFASIRRGVTPVVNAIASVLLLVTVSALVIGWRVVVRRSRERRGMAILGTDDTATVAAEAAEVAEGAV
ncbi:MAG TPA: ABC transporter permease [candidate division Zixibacteria bacterium]|nr:ABC transporter permease [candidate division Zixibacteria bacterium]